MKPRARRLTSAAACLTAGVIVVFVVLNWSTVRDHVEAWHFQLTRETDTTMPREGGTPRPPSLLPRNFFRHTGHR